MAIIYGTKANGKSGVLTEAELADMLHRKSGQRADIVNCTSCANYILNRSSLDEGGGTSVKDAGRTIFHFSRGRRGGGDGCSVFFTLTGGVHGEVKGNQKTKKDILVAGIVGVGWHTGATDHVYRLDWGSGRKLYTGSTFDTSVEKVVS